MPEKPPRVLIGHYFSGTIFGHYFAQGYSSITTSITDHHDVVMRAPI
jgi:hypothetical protein